METTICSDELLIQSYLEGNHQSFDKLLAKYKSQVFNQIIYKVKDRNLANDIFQDTFIKVIKSLHEGLYKDSGKFLAWVNRIAQNLIIDHYRKQKHLRFIDGDFTLDSKNLQKLKKEKSAELVNINNQLKIDLRRMVKHLPFDQREVLVLRLYFKMSYKEISDHTSVSINTALGRMRYAIININKIATEKNICLNMAEY